MDVDVPLVMEKITEAVHQPSPQEHIQGGIAKQRVNTPVPPHKEDTVCDTKITFRTFFCFCTDCGLGMKLE